LINPSEELPQDVGANCIIDPGIGGGGSHTQEARFPESADPVELCSTWAAAFL